MPETAPITRLPALVAGLSILAMTVLGPVAVLSVHGAVGTPGQGGAAVAGWAFVAIAGLDVAAAWGLWRVFRPAAPVLSALAAALRAGYAAGLVFLATALLSADWDHAAAGGFLENFTLLLGVFGLHLIVLAAAGLRAGYPPAWLSALVGLAGLGYLADAVGTAVVPGYALSLAAYVFFGELLLMGWLLIRAWRG